jgi:GNAT superfamily N-acetyltransferase
MAPSGVRIVPWLEIADPAELTADLDGIFFEASGTQTFPNAAARAGFRERWLGQFLRLDPGEAFLALDDRGRCVAFLVGCLTDPARSARFDDVGYFRLLADLTQSYPAHLHVNVAPEARGQGLGARLVEAFAAHAARAGAPGMHVVTSEGQRNVAFYARCGFALARTFPWNGRSLVLLARRLAA